MKKISFFLTISFLLLSTALGQNSQWPHFPIDHGHSSHICYGWAMARAFGKTSGDQNCRPEETYVGSLSYSTYFNFTNYPSGTPTNVYAGDIIAFERSPEGGTFGHVAFVESPATNNEYDPANISMSEIKDGGDGIGTPNYPTLQTLIYARGRVEGIYHIKSEWKIYVDNHVSFTEFPSSGTVSYQSQSGQFVPISKNNLAWGTGISLNAEMTTLNGVDAIFDQWTITNEVPFTSRQYSTNAKWNINLLKNFIAYYHGRLTVSAPTTTIPSGTTVKIGPDFQLIVQPNSELVVYGKLLVEGDVSHRVTITPGGSNTWKGVRFEGSGANGSKIQYCDINNALAPIVANNVGNLTINNVTIGTSSFYSSPGYAAMAFYNSSPTISYVTVNGQSNSWNGARFAQGSTGSISNSTIQNCGAGNGIVVEGNSTPAISNSTIQGNHYHGIVVGYNSTFPQITGNTIHDNGLIGGVKTYNGILFDNGHGAVMSNTIYGNNFGVGARNYSFPRSYYTIPDAGNNLITSNYEGLWAYIGSEIDFGYYDPDFSYGACNRIYLNDAWDAVAFSSSGIGAEGDYWISSPPQRTAADGTSYIDYSCYLESDDCNSSICGGYQAAASGSVNIGTSLRDARKALATRDFESAQNAYTYVISQSTKESDRLQALHGLYKVFLESKSPDLIEQVAGYKQEASNLATISKELEIYMNAGIGNYDKVKQLASDLRSGTIDPELDQRILTQLAWLGGHSEKERSFAATALTELKEKYGKSVDEGLLAAIGSAGADRTIESTSTETSGQFGLVSYPNPFNPSTEIRYKLQGSGKVTLRIFDMLGREIQTLVNTEQGAGLHTAQFEGSKLASGLYFARISVTPLEGNDQSGTLVETLRMLLTK